MREADRARSRTRFRFFAVALGIVVVGVAGYLGFIAVVSRREEVVGTLGLAAATGFAAFFSPCSFPLMLTFIGRRSEASPGSLAGSVLFVGAGAATVLALLALVVGLTGDWLGTIVNFSSPTGRLLRLLVAGFLLAFGARHAGLIRFPAAWLDRVATFASRILDPSRRQGPARDFVYGFGYLLAGFG
jgi:cytochrome c biogenesis protein CcdA